MKLLEIQLGESRKNMLISEFADLKYCRKRQQLLLVADSGFKQLDDEQLAAVRLAWAATAPLVSTKGKKDKLQVRTTFHRGTEYLYPSNLL